MRVRVRASLDPTKLSAFALPKDDGWLCVQVQPEYRPKMKEQILALAKRQRTKFTEAVEKWNAKPIEFRGKEPQYQDFLLDLELDLTIHYQKRSIDQNALLWSLYEIEANYLNGTPSYANGYWSTRLPGHIITPQQIHDDDVEVYCEKQRYQIWRKDRFLFTRAMELGELGRVMNIRDIEGQPEKIAVDVVKTTSFLTTAEMSQWTKRILDRLVDNGLLKSDESRFIGLKKDLQDIINGSKKAKG